MTYSMDVIEKNKLELEKAQERFNDSSRSTRALKYLFPLNVPIADDYKKYKNVLSIIIDELHETVDEYNEEIKKKSVEGFVDKK